MKNYFSPRSSTYNSPKFIINSSNTNNIYNRLLSLIVPIIVLNS